jgi:transcription elongation factor Elf1
MLRTSLPEKVFEKFSQALSRDALTAAAVEGLVTCHSCGMQMLMEEDAGKLMVAVMVVVIVMFHASLFLSDICGTRRRRRYHCITFAEKLEVGNRISHSLMGFLVAHLMIGNVATCYYCGKETCRLCGEVSHVPLRCAEVEKKNETTVRLSVEEAMTQARLRSAATGRATVSSFIFLVSYICAVCCA